MRSFRSGRLGSSPDFAGQVEPVAVPALRRSTRLLGLALGSAISRLRESRATVARLFARAEESALLLRMAREAAEILGARWDKVPERHRPHYQPEQSYRILRIRNLLGLSQPDTAQLFRVSIETFARWEATSKRQEDGGARPPVTPIPPVRRFADVARAIVKTMEPAGFGGNDLIARTLARAGWKLSARTVGRIRKEARPVPRLPPEAPTIRRAARARYPNHVWMLDLTDVTGLFGVKLFKVSAVFDVFSRMPLSARVFSNGPSAAEVSRLVSGTARRRGRPVHFVSDRARCFTARLFRRRLPLLRVKHRFGAVGKNGSIALIKRLWRTLKEALGMKPMRPLVPEDLTRKVELGLIHYAHFRPHQALGGATPSEIYFGRTPAYLSALPPPRGRPGQAVTVPRFEISFLDSELCLPVLHRQAA